MLLLLLLLLLLVLVLVLLLLLPYFSRGNVKADGALYTNAFPMGAVLNYMSGVTCSRNACIVEHNTLDNARVPAAHDPTHVVQDCTHWERIDVQRAIRFNISARKVRQSCDALDCSEAANAVLT